MLELKHFKAPADQSSSSCQRSSDQMTDLFKLNISLRIWSKMTRFADTAGGGEFHKIFESFGNF